MKSQVLFSSQTVEWPTPAHIYRELNHEFQFNHDPCPTNGVWNGLYLSWGSRTFANPPFRGIAKWVQKAYEESQEGKLVVMLIPSRTDTRWWHDYVMQAYEIRFIKGRLRFGNAKHNAPFPSCIVVFGNA